MPSIIFFTPFLYTRALGGRVISRYQMLYSHVFDSGRGPWIRIVVFIFDEVVTGSEHVWAKFHHSCWKFWCAIVALLLLIRLVIAVVKVIDLIDLTGERHEVDSFRETILHHFCWFIESLSEKSVLHIWLPCATIILAGGFDWRTGLSRVCIPISLVAVTLN